MIGRIFSIEEFATFDGPGIRMTVFLKGCPLRCTWCHNPEGQSFEREYKRSLSGCLHCGKCVGADGYLTAESVTNCPKGLVKECGQDVSVEELTAKILKNADILKQSGGGVTFSGGEPLSQIAFIEECAKRLHGLSVALQTSGYADEKTFSRALKICDYVLFDLKLWDREQHICFCGGDNENILRNYRLLAKSGVSFVTRIPLIPTVTDTEENLTSIADFMQENGVKYVELLPYNRAAGAKYPLLLRNYQPLFDDRKECKIRKAIFEQRDIRIKVL